MMSVVRWLTHRPDHRRWPGRSIRAIPVDLRRQVEEMLAHRHRSRSHREPWLCRMRATCTRERLRVGPLRPSNPNGAESHPARAVAPRGLQRRRSAPPATSIRFQRPSARSTLDTRAVEMLRGHPDFRGPASAHGPEHCLEVELPFLQVAAAAGDDCADPGRRRNRPARLPGGWRALWRRCSMSTPSSSCLVRFHPPRRPLPVDPVLGTGSRRAIGPPRQRHGGASRRGRCAWFCAPGGGQRRHRVRGEAGDCPDGATCPRIHGRRARCWR